MNLRQQKEILDEKLADKHKKKQGWNPPLFSNLTKLISMKKLYFKTMLQMYVRKELTHLNQS